MTEAYDSKIILLVATEVGEIGEVMHIAKSGRLIVKLNAEGSSIRPGEILIDSAGRRVGKVSELIGPVSSPYASVVPMTDRTARLAGAKVFAGGQQSRQQHFGRKQDRGSSRGRRTRN